MEGYEPPATEVARSAKPPLPTPLWFFVAGEILYLAYQAALAAGLTAFTYNYANQHGVRVVATLSGVAFGFWIYFGAVALCLFLAWRRSVLFPPVALGLCAASGLWETARLFRRLDLWENYSLGVGAEVIVAEPMIRLVWCVGWVGYGIWSRTARGTFGWLLR